MIESPTIHMWPGRLLYVGPAHETDEHAHHAHQITIGVTRDVCFEAGQGVRLEARAVLVPALRVHKQLANEAIISLYVDPQAHGRVAGIRAPARVVDVSTMPSLEGAFTWSSGVAWEGTERMLSNVQQRERPPSCPSPRVANIVRALREQLEEPPTALTLAAQLGVSVSRFTHLFTEAVGMPFRTYLLWLRLQRALETLAERHSLTRAAHDAGFSDSAHLSRTFHRMFGIAPSEVLLHARFVREMA